MKQFKDTKGRPWSISLTIAAVKRIKSLVGVDLLALDSKDEAQVPLVSKLAINLELICDVIFAAIKPQADAQDVSSEDFGEALGGDSISSAREAFFEELVDFFRQLGRTDLMGAIQTQENLIQRVIERAESRIKSLDADQFLSQLPEPPMPGKLSTALPASVGSIQKT